MKRFWMNKNNIKSSVIRKIIIRVNMKIAREKFEWKITKINELIKNKIGVEMKMKTEEGSLLIHYS